jgi:phosphomethylpyrimidine synthase
MDLSTGGDLDEIRRMFVAESPVPVGTVPIYEMIVDRDIETLTVDHMLQTIAKQAAQGVDFFTIHAGILREYLPLAMKRVCGIVSRGGAILGKWMTYHHRQNPLYEHFDEICAIMKEYNVAFSLGDGLRPGALADASDAAQLSELRTLGELTQRARQAGCPVIVEGPGHVPLDQIEYNMKLEQEICQGAPFYVLGPLVTDIGAGYDHISAAIGATLAAYHGASFLCYVTPTEHLGLPDSEAVRTGVVTFKIAAHAADIARGLPGARDRDDAMSRARANLDWPAMFNLALDGQKAKQIRHRDDCPGNDYCSMCGRNWCAIRINNELRAMLNDEAKPPKA